MKNKTNQHKPTKKGNKQTKPSKTPPKPPQTENPKLKQPKETTNPRTNHLSREEPISQVEHIFMCEIQTHALLEVRRKAKEVITSVVSIHEGFLEDDGLPHLLFLSVLFLALCPFLSLGNYRHKLGRIKGLEVGQLFPKPDGWAASPFQFSTAVGAAVKTFSCILQRLF